MTQPDTGFEIDGSWTTLEHEEAFLAQIQDDTELTYSSIGDAANGLPIWQASIGSGSPLMIVCLQHGTEPASREGALAWIRDVAYSTAPEIQEYLQDHQIVLVPNMNPGSHGVRRSNANGVDLNRDWWQATQPETQAVLHLIRTVDPVIVVDAHETSAVGADWRPYPAGLPGTYRYLAQAATEGYEYSADVLTDAGYAVSLYPYTWLPWAALSPVAGAMHAAGFLSETVTTGDIADRVDIQARVFDTLLDWHHTNSALLDSARQNSHEYAATTSDPVPYPVGEHIGRYEVVTADVEGYHLHEPLPDHLVQAHGITVDDVFVPINQAARLAVAALCDPESVERVVDAERVRRPPSPGSGVWSDTRVILNGLSYKVTHAWQVVNGSRRPIDGPDFKGLP